MDLNEPQRERNPSEQAVSSNGEAGFSDIDQTIRRTGHSRKNPLLLGSAAALCMGLLMIGGVLFSARHTPLATQSPSYVGGNAVITLSGADQTSARIESIQPRLQSEPAPASAEARPGDPAIFDGESVSYTIPLIDRQPGSGDRIRVDFNDRAYGTYDLSEKPYTLTLSLKKGDRVKVTCLSVSKNKTALQIEIATNLNPVVSHLLEPGQSQNWTVSTAQQGQQYTWYELEAARGNPTAQYGLGHMYQYGIGVPRNRALAAKWYRLAAAQNFSDAQTQLQRLGN